MRFHEAIVNKHSIPVTGSFIANSGNLEFPWVNFR